MRRAEATRIVAQAPWSSMTKLVAFAVLAADERAFPIPIEEFAARLGISRKRLLLAVADIRRLANGHVYFAQDTRSGLIKVGRAADVTQRLRALQTGNGARLELLAAVATDDAQALERELHRGFADLHETGEWFRPGRGLLSLVASLAKETETCAGLLRRLLPTVVES